MVFLCAFIANGLCIGGYGSPNEEIIQEGGKKPEYVKSQQYDKKTKYQQSVSYVTFKNIETQKNNRTEKESLFSPQYVKKEIEKNITNKTKNTQDLFDTLKKEQTNCKEKSCNKNYCIWITEFGRGDFIKRVTPKYCIDFTISPPSCFPMTEKCVVINDYRIEDHKDAM